MAINSSSIPRTITSFSRIEFDLDFQLEIINKSIKYNEKLIEKQEKNLKDYLMNCPEAQNNKTYSYEITFLKLKQFLRFSNLILIFSIFENKLKELCEIINDETNIKLKHTDLKSNNGDIGSFYKFLTHVLDIETNTLNNKLRELFSHKIVRNAFVHSLGIINISKVSNIKNLTNINLTELNEGFQISITSEKYLEDVMNLIKQTLKETIDLIDNKMNKLLNIN